MRKLVYLITSVIILTGCITNNKLVIDSSLKHPIFNSNDSILNPLTIKTDLGYDGILDSSLYPVSSSLIINNDSNNKIRFSTFKKSNDTTKISFQEINPAFYHNLNVYINKNRFNITYNYVTSGKPIKHKIKTLQQKLILKKNIIPNNEIQGYILYVAEDKYEAKTDTITIEGYFKSQNVK